jgi:hypothetical protein
LHSRLKPLVERSGRREKGQAPSQDTGWIVLVVMRACACINFSVKEKDEASPAAGLRAGSLNGFLPSFAV